MAGEFAARKINLEAVLQLSRSVDQLRARGYDGPLDLETLAETLSAYGITADFAGIAAIQIAMSQYGRPDLSATAYAAPFDAARVLDVMLFGKEEVRLQDWHILGRNPERGIMPRSVSVRVSRRNRCTDALREDVYNDDGLLTRLTLTDASGSVTTTFDRDGRPQSKIDHKGRVTTYRVSAQLIPGSSGFRELERLVPDASQRFSTVDRIEYEDPETRETHVEFRTRLGQLIAEKIAGTSQATVVNDRILRVTGHEEHR